MSNFADTLNVHAALCQLHFNETERKNLIKKAYSRYTFFNSCMIFQIFLPICGWFYLFSCSLNNILKKKSRGFCFGKVCLFLLWIIFTLHLWEKSVVRLCVGLFHSSLCLLPWLDSCSLCVVLKSGGVIGSSFSELFWYSRLGHGGAQIFSQM